MLDRFYELFYCNLLGNKNPGTPLSIQEVSSSEWLHGLPPCDRAGGTNSRVLFLCIPGFFVATAPRFLLRFLFRHKESHAATKVARTHRLEAHAASG